MAKPEEKIISTNLNVPDQILIGLGREAHAFDPENPPLAMMTQVSDDAAFAKRKETMFSWMRVGYGKEPDPERLKTFDNVPLTGFRFDHSVSRWTTSNKWFTISDPRGFQLQIAADNLGDIILNTEIKNGELLGEYVWAKNGANVFLCRTSHPSYQAKVNPKVGRSTILPGDTLTIGKDATIYEYLGCFQSIILDYVSRYQRKEDGVFMAPDFEPRYGYSYSYARERDLYSVSYLRVSKRDEKPLHVFRIVRRIVNMDNNYLRHELYVMRSVPKRFNILSENENFEPLEFGKAYGISSNFSGFIGIFFNDSESADTFHNELRKSKNIDSVWPADHWYDRVKEYSYFGSLEDLNAICTGLIPYGR